MNYLEKINSPEDLKKLDIKEMEILAQQIREFLISTISETGGHLASNLGVVELTIALHYCFNSPQDKLVWDVGHQSYIHKILTGRRSQFHTLRKFGGLSGFPKSGESPHDIIDTGHSSTSISAGLGLAVTRDLNGENYSVISIIGDGSMTGGLAFEALNCAGRADTNLIVILNDNQMSISENVGALSSYLNNLRTAPGYLGAKADITKLLNKVPVVGEKAVRAIERIKDSLKYMVVNRTVFDEYGFNYIGPVDGHNLESLINVLKRIKKMKGPVLLHVYTKKGKGYSLAEKSPEDFHGVGPYDIESGEPSGTKIWNTYSDVFGKTITELAGKNEKIVAVTAAMPSGTGLSHFAQKFPKRFFDVGIAEAHAVSFAAGMAKNGFIPVFAVYSTFLQRAYDQILHDVCLQNLHVVFAVDRAGVVGGDGETHQGLYDLAYLSHIPNMTIVSPKNRTEFIDMLNFAVNTFNGPIAVRYPRGAASNKLKGFKTPVEYGKCEKLTGGEKILIIAFGEMVETAIETAEKLTEAGHNPALINARFVKPLDIDLIDELSNYEFVFTMENAVKTGGLSQKVAAEIAERKIDTVFYAFAFPDVFLRQGDQTRLLAEYGLDAASVAGKIMEIVQGAQVEIMESAE
ncbi:MAG: 1-deoxy-D-xylulose-5-phosphate synthase [Clostridiales bacterium]|nr:1-deoxy-D-xylulose-5-phosphate synthase [Clostridiales bacterium]